MANRIKQKQNNEELLFDKLFSHFIFSLLQLLFLFIPDSLPFRICIVENNFSFDKIIDIHFLLFFCFHYNGDRKTFSLLKSFDLFAHCALAFFSFTQLALALAEWLRNGWGLAEE